MVDTIRFPVDGRQDDPILMVEIKLELKPDRVRAEARRWVKREIFNRTDGGRAPIYGIPGSSVLIVYLTVRRSDVASKLSLLGESKYFSLASISPYVAYEGDDIVNVAYFE